MQAVRELAKCLAAALGPSLLNAASGLLNFWGAIRGGENNEVECLFIETACECVNIASS